MLARNGRRLIRILWKCSEKRLKLLGLELEGGRKLPQDGSEFAPETQQAGCEEVGHGIETGFIAKPQHVGQVAWPFDGEYKAVWRGIVPLLVARGCLQGVMRAVDLYRLHLPRRKLQLSRLRELGRVEVFTPPGITPSGDSYAYGHRDAARRRSPMRKGRRPVACMHHAAH